MEKVIWSDRALADLGHIVRYIALNNPEAAIRLGQGMIDLTKLLGAFPKMGRIHPKSKRRDRYIPHKGYLIFYHQLDEHHAIEIIRILHGARDLDDLA
jgi:toxin ParE1/3/4